MLKGIHWNITEMNLSDSYYPYVVPKATATLELEIDSRFPLCSPTCAELMDDLRERLGTQPSYGGLFREFSRTTANALVNCVEKYARPSIENVIFNDPATIIIWDDGSKSVVKVQNGEPFDAEKGFALAYLKKLLGNDNTFNKEIHKWVKYEEPKKEEVVVEWCVVNRFPKIGDYIRLKRADYTFNKIGDILKVHRVIGDSVRVLGKDQPRDTGYSDHKTWCYLPDEFDVVEKCKE